jgi:hypothetical protein
MSNVTFILQLDQSGNPGNAARMWLDTSRNDIVEPGEELTMSTIDGLMWRATKSVSGSTSGMQFLVKFIAPIGTKWSFTATSDGTKLFEIKDEETVTSKEVLAGRLS